MSIPEDQLTEAIASTLGKRQGTIGKAAMDFLAPAKRHNASAITLPSGEAIGTDAIKALPSDAELAQFEPSVETQPYENVTVVFQRHDKTRPKDWAATIAEISPERKALHLAPDIRPEELFTRESVKADVLVTSIPDNEGDYVPSVYYLSKVRDDDAQTSP